MGISDLKMKKSRGTFVKEMLKIYTSNSELKDLNDIGMIHILSDSP
jgi:hypothetical protein